MRVLMLSKALLSSAYQTKLEGIARHDDVELVAIVPPSWDAADGQVALERRHVEGYTLLVDPIRFNGNYHFYYFPTLADRLLEFRPDIVHIDEEPYNVATWMAQREAQRIGARTVFFSWQNIERTYPPPFRWLEQRVYAGIDYAIMGNEDAVAVCHSKGYRGPYTVIPQFGVDPELFSPATTADEGRAFIIGSANRRLVPEKGVDIVLDAAAKLPGVWRLHVAGEGPARAALQQQAYDLGIQARVHFDGGIVSEQMPGYLREMNVLVLTSRTLPNWKEQFGRVLIEAMACGVPVIGSDSGEIPHVIGDAGLIVPEGDAGALRDALLQLMQDEPLRHDLIKRGRERVLAHYTQDRVAADTVSVYRQMMQNGQR